MFRPTARGCCRMYGRIARLSTSDRHYGHWRWLQCLPQPRYARAIRLWHNLYHVRPRGVVALNNAIRLNLDLT